MELIDKQQAYITLTEHYQHRMLIQHLMLYEALDRVPVVDAVPIEWINQRVKGLKIQLINADEDDVDLIWHLRDEIQTLTELIDYWKEEQEKQNGHDA